MRKIFSNNTGQIILIIASAIIATSLLLRTGLPNGHDTYAHTTYSKLFSHALSQGQFPVRWVEHAWVGFGQPLFNYYQVGFFYLVSFIHLLLPNITTAIKASTIFIWIMGAIFLFLFTRKYGQHSAVVAFIVYLFSPYLLLDIFVRSSFPELTALSLIPGVFWSIDKFITTRKSLYIPILATLLGATFISHLPTVVLFSPLITLYTFFMLFENHSNLRSWLMLCAAVLLGISLSAFYVIPAVSELNLIQIQKMQSGQFNFNANFVQPSDIFSYIWGYNGDWWGTHQPTSALIGVMPWAIILFAIIFLFRTTLKHRQIPWQLTFWLFCIGYAFFFMHKLSAPVWSAIPIFAFFQFPWRFFMLMPIATAVLSAILLSKVMSHKYHIATTLIIFFVTILTTVPFFITSQFLHLDYFNLPFDQWRKHQEARHVAFWEPGYTPKGVTITPRKDLPQDEFPKIWSVSGDATITEQHVKPHSIAVIINANRQTTFVTNTPYFPYWKAYLDGESAKISPSDPYHYMNINIPPGKHTLELEFSSPTIVKASNYISLSSLIILFIIFSIEAIQCIKSYKLFTF